MTPNLQGRSCRSCSKTVVDFTNKSDEEIQVIFHKQGKLCGRFKKTQLEGLTLTIPQHIITQQHSFRSSFLIALFITMGTTIFSCTAVNGEQQAIDNIIVIDNNEVTAAYPPIKISDTLQKTDTTILKDSNESQIPITPMHQGLEQDFIMGEPMYHPIHSDETSH